MRIKLLIEQVGSTVRNVLFSPLGWLAACFLREYLCEMTERKKTGCLGDGCHRQLGISWRLVVCEDSVTNPLPVPLSTGYI